MSVCLESPFELDLGVAVRKQMRLSSDAHRSLRDTLWKLEVMVCQEIHHDHIDLMIGKVSSWAGMTPIPKCPTLEVTRSKYQSCCVKVTRRT